LLYRWLSFPYDVVCSATHAANHLLMRASGQLREALVHPLKPFPLAHVASGVGTGSTGSSQRISVQDTMRMRDHRHPFGIAGLPPATLQNAHAFLTLLPTWLPMPETRRHGHGQVQLEWSGHDGRHFSVLIGSDGMLIYSARLGAKGRFDGAEPVSDQLSPVVAHVLRQLQH
jgi:hypothetical protein